MRRFAFLALSCTLLGSAIAVSRQDDPPAEKTFRNITSFKGSKTSDIIPAMEFMSASLGVGCDFCHTADRASDEKRAKGTAREMIAMQRDINQRNFNGRNRVTCATCHSGHAQPIPVPPVAGVTDRTRRSNDVKPDDVLAAYTKAAGEASQPLTSLRLSGTITEGTEKSKVDAAYSGDKFVYLTHAAKGDQLMGFNGTMAFFGSPKGVQQVPKMYVVSRLNEKMLMTGPAALPKLDTPTGGTANFGGHDQLVVTGTMADKTRVSLFFDKGTGLLSRSSYSYPTILGNILQINDYSDYKRVNGAMVPMKIANHDSEGDHVMEIRSFRVDTNIPASEFEPPK